MEPLIIQNRKQLLTTRPVYKFLLLCGTFSSLVYVIANMVGAMIWQGYSTASQTVSELSAIDAPSRPLMIWFFTGYSLLVIAFGLGVKLTAGTNGTLKTLSSLLMLYGFVCLTAPLTPMHLRQELAAAGKSLTDTMHIISTIVDLVFILLIIGFAAATLGKGFRLYSKITIFVLFAFGVWTGLDVANMEANLPTPWMGIKERINIGAFLLWMIVLSFVLVRRERFPVLNTVH
jgi:hypothetical protein